MLQRLAALYIIVAVFGFCATAHASITAFWQPVPITPAAIANDPVLANMQCWDLKVTTSGNWTLAGLRAVLPAGNVFYAHAAWGGLHRPNPFLFPLIPGLEFTTYVMTIRPEFDPSALPPILGGFPEGQPVSRGDAASAVPGTLSATWGDLINDPPGTYQIARLTFPRGVFPNIINIADVGLRGQFSFTAQVVPDSVIEIPDIPEPPVAAIAALGSLLLRRAGG